MAVVLEKLLRSTPNVRRIVVLVRPKKKATPEQRFDELLLSSVFDHLKQTLGTEKFIAHARAKVQVVSGDLMLPRMGVSDDEWKQLTESVQVRNERKREKKRIVFLKVKLLVLRSAGYSS